MQDSSLPQQDIVAWLGNTRMFLVSGSSTTARLRLRTGLTPHDPMRADNADDLMKVLER